MGKGLNPMSQQYRHPVFAGGLACMAVLVLMAHLPAGDVADRDRMLLGLFFTLLAALALSLAVVIPARWLASPVPTVALMALLTLGKEGAALWSIAIGVLMGSVIAERLAKRAGSHPPNGSPWLYSACVRLAQVTLSLFAGAWAYERLDGRLPLDAFGRSDVVPSTGLAVVFLTVYFGLFWLELRADPHLPVEGFRAYWQALAGTILVPLPLAFLGALTYHRLSVPAFGILVAGLLIVVGGVHVVARAQARYQQQILELSSLAAISQAVRSSPGLTALLEVVFQQVVKLLDVNNMTVALYDPSRGELSFPLHIQNGQPHPLATRAFENGVIEHVIQTGVSLLLPDHVARRAQEMGLTPPQMSVHSWLGVPLLAPDRVTGCLAVYSIRPEHLLSLTDQQLLITLAGQVSVAIDNAQLYGQASDRSVQLATLNNVAHVLSGSLDVQQVLDLVISSAVAVAGCDATALYLWPEAARPLTLVRHSGLRQSFAVSPPDPLLLDVEDLRRRLQPLIVTDAHTDRRTDGLRADMDHHHKRAWIELLLRKGGDLLGILVLYYNSPRQFSSEEVELLRNFSTQAALAVSNARLYTLTDQALDRRVGQLSALADISRELASTLDLPGLFRLVLDRALEATQSQSGVLLVHTEGQEPLEVVASYGYLPGAATTNGLLTGPTRRAYETGHPVLVADITQEKDFMPADDRIRAQLNVPITHEDGVLGVIMLGSEQPGAYGPDDLAFVAQIANQARIAINNARLFQQVGIQRDRLQIILDSMHEGVILLHASGQITLANPRVKDLLGLDPQHLLEKPAEQLAADPDLGLASRLGLEPAVLRAVIRDLASGVWNASDYDGGRITFQVSEPKERFIDRVIMPLANSAGNVLGLLMVFADVTEQHELAQAREDLSSMIVHDLRGPLTAIQTSLKLLGEVAVVEEGLDDTIRQTTDMSSRAVRKLIGLVDTLLDISRLESGAISIECEPTDLWALSDAVAEDLSPLAVEAGVEIQNTVPEDLPPLDVDAEKIERVLLNLLDNAIKYMPSGGTVTVHAYPPGEAGALSEFVRVDVIDTGPGIPDDYKGRLFDRFVQVAGQRGRRRGTGLGLAFCRLAVGAHKGHIWAEDNPAGGTIMAFTLPVARLDDLEVLEDDF